MLPKNANDAFHLLSRAGFGMNPFYLSQLPMRNHKLYALLASESDKPFTPISLATNRYELVAKLKMAAMQSSMDEPAMMAGGGAGKLNAEDRKRIQQGSREDQKNISLAWQKEMVQGTGQLREKMALFWHGHFSARDQNLFFHQLLLQDIRSGALGKFRDLLGAVSKSATMLGFLNNRQNRKNKPNENFAREVMELFTLGRGHYTENDVKEAARAFTGWTHGPGGKFYLNKRQHDDGPKTILGQTGNFGGEDVLDMLVKNPQTAYFLTHKICRYLVNDRPDEQEVKRLADAYYKSDLNTGVLLEKIFTGKWFYAPENRGNLIKSPVHLFVEMQRQIPLKITNPAVQLVLQRGLGQLMFFPPNVAGWPGGKAWIDSSSLMLRMRIPQMLQSATPIPLKLKSDDDVQMGLGDAQANAAATTAIPSRQPKANPGGGNQFLLRTQVDWAQYIQLFEKTPREELYAELYRYLLPNVPPSFTQQTVEAVADKSSREQYIKTVSIALMSTPEYQLC